MKPINTLVFWIFGLLAALSGCKPSISPLHPPVLIPTTTTWTPLSTGTTTTTLTITPMLTISPEGAYSQLTDLLNNSDFCRLPCWLGILPGTSTVNDVQAQIAAYRSITINSYFSYPAGIWSVAEMTIPYDYNDVSIEIRSDFLSMLSENEILITAFDTRAYELKDGAYHEDIYEYPAYSTLLGAYSLRRILSLYGQPNKIFVRSDLFGGSSLSIFGFFIIHIWYPDNGIFLEYKMIADESGGNFNFCPSASFVSGVLLPSGQDTSYQDILEEYGGIYPLFFPPATNIKTPEEALGLTSEGFYHLFSTPTDQCLETPKTIWWP